MGFPSILIIIDVLSEQIPKYLEFDVDVL
jgi:hypothetical protein